MPQAALKIAPSILSADFSKLGDEVREVDQAGADWIHVDVMDGHFVPNLTIGPLIVQAIRPVTKLPLDCHLMVAKPQDWIDGFAKAGASVITIHAETAPNAEELLAKIRAVGCRAGVSLNPATPLSSIEKLLPHVDLVLVMSVNPGFGGQKFIESSIAKVEELVRMRSRLAAGRHFLIEIDGGVGTSNISRLRKAGVDIFVAGSAVFAKPDRAQAIMELRRLGEQG